MIVHSYYYGPGGNGDFDLQTTRGLTQVISEDTVRELYSMEGNPKKPMAFSKIYNTLNGPVIGITRIEPAQSNDKRTTIINKTFFVKVEDVVSDLAKVLDSYYQTKDVKPIELFVSTYP